MDAAPEQGAPPAGWVGYGLSQTRVAEVLQSTAALEAVVLRLASQLPFEAEPWGFGQGLMRLVGRE